MRDVEKMAYVGILSLIFLVPQMTLMVWKMITDFTGTILVVYHIINVLGFITGTYFMWGFKILSKKTDNQLLSVSVISIIIFSLLTLLLDMFSLYVPESITAVKSIAILVMGGVLSIFLGIGLLKLNKELGVLATTTGVLNIISGACYITIIFSFVSVVIIFPLGILDIILLFKASDKLKI